MEYIYLICALLLLFLFIMGKEYLTSKRREKVFIKRLYDQYGMPKEREYQAGELDEHIAMYYRRHKENDQIDEITWHDLGMDEVYKSINYSYSSAGDEYLYYRLRTPITNAGLLDAFEKHVGFFMAHADERVMLQLKFAALGRMKKYSLYEYLEHLEELGERNSLKYYLAILCVAASIGIMFFSVPVGIVALLAVLCRNMVCYFKEHKEIEPYITSFQYVFRLMDASRQTAKLPIAEIEKERESLKDCCKKMEGFKQGSFLVMSSSGGRSISSSNFIEVILDYLRMLLYLDLIKFNQMLGVVRENLDAIDEMITIIGALETAVVVGEMRTGRKDGWCTPDFPDESREGMPCIKMERFYHPLLTDPVKNDLDTGRGVLLTGSNASGKSTFLRAVALNVVLAQTLHTCMADSYYGSFFRVFSSMSLQDDLISGDSYYMVEVKSIQRILNQAQEGGEDAAPVLCFVDEVLRGTNTVERIAASTQILRALSGRGVLCFAATHDVELTKLLAKEFDNYHFEEEIQEDDIFFPYRLQKGPAHTRNAIALLRMLGYDASLVKDAEEMADVFLRTGDWKG